MLGTIVWTITALFCFANIAYFMHKLGRSFIRTRGDLTIALIISVIPIAQWIMSAWFLFMHAETIEETSWFKAIEIFFNKEL